MRYLLFMFDSYYPQGGINDLVGRFDSLEDAELVAEHRDYEWYQIYDTVTQAVVRGGGSAPRGGA